MSDPVQPSLLVYLRNQIYQLGSRWLYALQHPLVTFLSWLTLCTFVIFYLGSLWVSYQQSQSKFELELLATPLMTPNVEHDAPHGAHDLPLSVTLSNYNAHKDEPLSLIALNNNIQLATLMSLNNITSLAQKSRRSSYIVSNVDGMLHTLKHNQKLDDMTKIYQVSQEDLINANTLSNQKILDNNQIVFIPNVTTSHEKLNKMIGDVLLYPVPGQIFRRFGQSIHSMTETKIFNDGIDIATSLNQTVLASASGRVVKTGFHSLYGYYVIVQHKKDLHTLYGYLDGIEVKVGQTLRQYEPLGHVGTSGYTNGHWLHFCVFVGQKVVDPTQFLR